MAGPVCHPHSSRQFHSISAKYLNAIHLTLATTTTTTPHTKCRAGYKWPEVTVTWQDLCVTRTAVPADESVPNLLQPLTQLFRRQQPSSITALQPTSGVLRPGGWGGRFVNRFIVGKRRARVAEGYFQ
jgi:hypothetical protein